MKVIVIDSARHLVETWNDNQTNGSKKGDVVMVVDKTMKERVDKFVKEQGQYFIKTMDAVVTILQENGRTSKYAQKIALAFLANENPAKFIEWPAVHEDMLDLVDEMIAQEELRAVTVDEGSIDTVEDLIAACAFVNCGPNHDSGYEILYEMTDDLKNDVRRFSEITEFLHNDLGCKDMSFCNPKNLNDYGKAIALFSEVGYGVEYKTGQFGLSEDEIGPEDMPGMDKLISKKDIGFKLNRIRR